MLQTHATGTRLSVPQSSWRNVSPGLIMICTSFLIINFPKIGKMMKDVLIGVNKKLGGYAQKVISEKLLPLSLVNVATNPPPFDLFSMPVKSASVKFNGEVRLWSATCRQLKQEKRAQHLDDRASK
jgi:hypothetical protein